MKFTLSSLLFLCFGLHLSIAQPAKSQQQFSNDLESLQQYFHIPGMAAIVKKGEDIIYENYTGLADIENQVPVEANTIFPVASLTKIFAATLIFQLAEEGKLSLEDPMKKYFPKAGLPETVKIKHVLSHTSQGVPGKDFFYSFRYSYLTQVIEQASGRSFSELMNEKVLQPLDMQHTALLASEQQALDLGDQIAQPYSFQGTTEPGRFDPGFSAAAGLMMTPRDLLLFDQALDHDQLFSQKNKRKMFTPFYEGSPYGLGIFTQEFVGKKLIWGYGQYDCYSSLYLKVPEEELTLVLFANNNLMSDPARLIYGDVTYSLFALSFLKNFVFGFPEKDRAWGRITPPFKSDDALRITPNRNKWKPIMRQQMLAWGLAKSFMGQAFDEEKKESRRLLEYGLGHFQNHEIYGNLSLLHALIMHIPISDDYSYIDKTIVKVGEKLLEKCPDNPYANLYMAEYYASQGEEKKALAHFKTIADAQNYERFWYTREALDFIQKYYRKKGEAVPEQYKN